MKKHGKKNCITLKEWSEFQELRAYVEWYNDRWIRWSDEWKKQSIMLHNFEEVDGKLLYIKRKIAI